MKVKEKTKKEKCLCIDKIKTNISVNTGNTGNKGWTALYKNFYKLVRKRWSQWKKTSEGNEQAAPRRMGTNGQYELMLNLTK